MERYDAIVIGLGVMGGATAATLASRGYRVLGLESFQRNHAFGSSHGRSRIIREAYFEAPDYVPLLLRSYELWRELEAEAGEQLLVITGGLNIGEADSEFVVGARRSAELFGLEHEVLRSDELNQRFPGFRFPESSIAVYEPTAGFLRPESCVGAYLDRAANHEAELHFDEEAFWWSVEGDAVVVRTNQDTYRAGRLVLTPGPWASELLGELELPLRVQRVVNVHFQPNEPDRFQPERCPIYIFLVPEGHFYGFPALPGEGVKIGRHDTGELCTPRSIRRTVDRSEIDELRHVLDRYLPGASGPVISTLTCMYTNTPDQHFILDRHPEHPQVVFGCGFSGHGFKLAPAVGEVLADLAIEGRTKHEIGFLALERLQATASA